MLPPLLPLCPISAAKIAGLKATVVLLMVMLFNQAATGQDVAAGVIAGPDGADRLPGHHWSADIGGRWCSGVCSLSKN